ncbi:MAG: class I SAM-dependent methyltransferase [Candidatus Hydrogenedentota bacterium]
MREVAPQRKHRVFQKLSGRVLEIGPGAGANMPLYPRNTSLIGIEPNLFLFRYLRREAHLAHRHMHLLNGRAEALCLADNSIDAVVCTHVLCSVDDIAASLSEIMRVLKPGGLFIFLEHIAAPRKTTLRFIQQLLRPAWHTFGDGCRLDRELWRTLEFAGFAELAYEHFRVHRALVVSPHIVGWARKASTP